MRVILVDLRNHGRSPHVPRHDYASMAGDVVSLLDALRLPRAAVVGHSMGGKAAMELALRWPARVDRLAVLDVGPRRYDGRREVLDALLSVDMRSARSREDLDTMLSANLRDQALRAFLLMGASRVDGDGFTWKFNLKAITENWDTIAGDVGRGEYEGPTLFLRGEKSDYVSASDLPVIRERFPRAAIVPVPNAGHWLHIDAPDRTGELVRDFLAAQ
jgi:esterase